MSDQALMQPFDMRGMELPNRVVMAPMTRARAGESRVPNALMAEYYSQRASAGLIITEATVISQQGIGWQNSAGIITDEQAEGWKQVVDAVHAKGGRIFLQLWHCGRASHSAFHNGELPVAPSALKIENDHIHTPEGKKDYEVPRALETAEMPGIVADYAAAAARAKPAGFDGVEIHGANGYLLDQFLQSKTNQRTDDYGGSIENRYRLLSEVVAAVSEVWPSNRVGVRISPNGAYNAMGSPEYRELFLHVASQLETANLAYLHIMDGIGFGFHELGPAMTLDEFRKVFHGPIIGSTGYTQATAEAAVADGNADMIAFGRPYISNPDLVERFANGWPQAEDADMAVWYSFDEKGYADWPTYQNGQA